MREMTLRDMFETHGGRQIDKWEHYFPIYEKHFERFRGKKIRLLELGVDHGGSLQLWKRYFGKDAEIIGIDNRAECGFEEDQIKVYHGDQRDRKIATLGPFDIIIDDGAHFVEHQILSFENLWPRCKGVYLIEDCQAWQNIPGTGQGLLMDVTPYPPVRAVGALEYKYPWVVVYERPQRLIRGVPARPLSVDEAKAQEFNGYNAPLGE